MTQSKLVLLLNSLILVCCSMAAAEEPSKPNVILINADDLGYGDLGCYGATLVRTPNIDRLARQGRRFTDAHSSSAVCSPSRFGLLTGCYPLRKNLWGPVAMREPLTVDPSQVTIASLLKEQGYETACIGKWHLGFGIDTPNWNGELNPGPLELGFDYYFGIPSVNSGPPFVYVEDHHVVGADPDDPLVYGQTSVTPRRPEKSGYGAIGGGETAHRLYVDEELATQFAAKAVDWLKDRSDDNPFFLYLATTNIHHPFTPAERFVGTSDCGRYGDFIHELDWVVGEVLRSLEELEVEENTLVIFTSDNGGMLNVTAQEAWKSGHRLNGDLLGFKFGAWEGGHRVPLIARWPARIPSGTVSDCLIGHVDLLATIAAATNASVEEVHPIDSIDQLANFVGPADELLRETLVITPNSPKHLSIRHQDWIYIPDQGDGGFQGKKPGEHLFSGAPALAFTGQPNSDVNADGTIRRQAPTGQLYNLADDPSQTTNLFHSRPEIVRNLESRLNEYRALIPDSRRIGWINLQQ